MTRAEAFRLREIIEMAFAGKTIDDQTASEAILLFPRLKQDGSLIAAGTRINWNGVIKRANVDLWDMDINTPDNAPTLWSDIAYRDGMRLIPEIITAETAFAFGELGWWADTLYRSLRDGNTFPPTETPEWWEAVS